MDADQFTPATPAVLLPVVPMMPAQCVPWPLSSIGTQVELTAFTPRDPAGHVTVPVAPLKVNVRGADHMFAVRSGWLKSTPVSTTATTVFRAPVA